MFWLLCRCSEHKICVSAFRFFFIIIYGWSHYRLWQALAAKGFGCQRLWLWHPKVTYIISITLLHPLYQTHGEAFFFFFFFVVSSNHILHFSNRMYLWVGWKKSGWKKEKEQDATALRVFVEIPMHSRLPLHISWNLDSKLLRYCEKLTCQVTLPFPVLKVNIANIATNRLIPVQSKST